MMKSVLLGFSGGIDSSLAAQKLLGEGYRVIALTLDMGYGDDSFVRLAQEKASEIGVDFRMADVRSLFRREVVDYFVASYERGETPAPCTLCNPLIKWRILHETAEREGIDHIATGHYFRVECYNNIFYVAKAADPTKDQSYYLWMLSQDILKKALSPMGGVIKSEITRQGERESMGVCFLKGRDYRDFLLSEGCRMYTGEIIDSQGKVVGQHEGLAQYTVGQKRGLPDGMYVRSIDSHNNRIVAGAKNDLFRDKITLRDVQAVNIEELLNSTDITVKVRGFGLNPEGFGHIEQNSDAYILSLDTPAWAIASGQPVVFYRGERVIGGGFVK